MIKDTAPINAHTVLRTILSACTLLMLIAAAAAAMPPVPYFSQCDSRWSGDQLGGDGPTICGVGCALTSAAMVAAYYGVDTDPKRLNDAIGRGGYDAGYNIYWSAVRNACHDENNQIEYDPGTVDYDETVLNSSLDSGRPVIVHVYCPGYGGYWGGHFVVVTGRSDEAYYINDPASSTRSTLDDYPTRYGMRIFSGSLPAERVNTPLVGDWNGNGTDTTGIYNYTTAEFSLDSGLKISFGISGDIPITGDWNGNGYDTIGVFRPSTAQFFLDYDNDAVSDMNATFGVIGDIPVAGDWDSDGDDNIGVFRQNHSGTGLTMFFLDLDNSGGSADQSVAFGNPDDLPVIGDWDGDGDDNIGLYRSVGATGVFYLDLDNDGGTSNIVTPEYGDLGDIPIAGDWDGDGDDNIGVYRPDTGEFFMDATVPDVSASKTIYVDDDFSDDPSEHKWNTIQEGVDDAADGDTVIVYAGEYYENVDVNKRITLEGAGADVVTVRAASVYDRVFEVTADYVTISGFTVTGATGWEEYGMAGIYLDYANHCNISDNNASENCYGIDLYFSNDNMLTNNAINSNSYCGIYLLSSSNSKLTNNTMSGNGYNFGVGGYYAQNIDTSNTVDGKPIYYWVDQQDKQIPSDAGFVGVVNSTNITVKDVTIANNTEGVLFAYTENSRIENVSVSNSSNGVYLYYSNYNTLHSNTANLNTRYGIWLRYSSSNTLTNNIASNNYHGIYMRYSSNNTLQSNTISGNTYNFGVYGYGDTLSHYAQNIDASNTVDGKPIYYWVDQQDKQIPDDAGYVGVVNSTNITVKDVTIANNTEGVLFAYTENSRIENVSVSNSSNGVYLYYSNYNTLHSNTASICMRYSSSNTLMSNIASNNSNGIYLYYSNYNTLMSNTANSNSGSGIDLFSSDDNVLQGNTANSNNYRGIYISSSSSNTLQGNIMSGNLYNFGVDGWGLSDYIHNIDTSNRVDEKPIYYWVDQQDQQIPNDAGFVGVVDSTNITVKDLILMNNGQGVLFAFTENSRIENVTANSNSGSGIYLYFSNYNTLQNNTANSNNYNGIYLMEWSNYNTLTGNTASENNKNGIYLYSSSNNTLQGNTANSNTRNGIYLLFSSNCNIIANGATSNNVGGICISRSSYNTLTGNTVNSNYCHGIYLDSSSNNTLQGNTMSGNMYNFGVSGYPSIPSDYTQNIDTSNTVDGKPIYYWVDQQDKQIIGDAGFVAVVNSNNITVKDLTLTNNTQGVLFACTESSRIENVSVSDNWWGIYLYSSSSNTLTKNTAKSNSANGIYMCSSSNSNTLTDNTVNSNNYNGISLSDSSNNTLTENTASDNSRIGIGMWYSNNNTVYHNSLLDNRINNAFDTSTNAWDSGSAGNYWSDYTGTDSNGDGIGNDPHLIPGGGSIDHFPLMQPWTDTPPQNGDLNGDNEITPADAAIALQIAAGGSASCDAATLAAADVSGDNRVTSLDALMILQAAAGAIEL